MNKVLVFDIRADYAHFKKYFTTMSPLSFSIPPRTVIAGIIGAIVGIDKKVNPETFKSDNSLISLCIMNKIKKTKIASNNIKAVSFTELSRFKQHKPTNYEFIKDCKYRIIFSHKDDNLYEKLKGMLINHLSTYTLCLGISQCIANYDYIGEFEIKKIIANDNINIHSIIPIELTQEIDFLSSNEMQKSVLPNNMQNDREVTEYKEFLFDVKTQPITVKLKPNIEINQITIDNQELNFLGM